MIYDTDVLIWTLRGHLRAVQVVDRDASRSISIVTQMELFRGALNKPDLHAIRRFLKKFTVLSLSEEIGRRACAHMEQLALKAGLDPMDALIAATAVDRGELLCTANMKHYRQIRGLNLHAFRP